MAYVTMEVTPEVTVIIFLQQNVETQEMECLFVSIYKYTCKHMTCSCNTIRWGRGGIYRSRRYEGSNTHTNLGTFAKFRKVTISFVMSVRPSARNNSSPSSRIFIKFDI